MFLGCSENLVLWEAFQEHRSAIPLYSKNLSAKHWPKWYSTRKASTNKFYFLQVYCMSGNNNFCPLRILSVEEFSYRWRASPFFTNWIYVHRSILAIRLPPNMCPCVDNGSLCHIWYRIYGSVLCLSHLKLFTSRWNFWNRHEGVRRALGWYIYIDIGVSTFVCKEHL